MSDDSESRILAAIGQLRTDLTGEAAQFRADVTGEIARLRADLMARMDRLQHRLDNLNELNTMSLGHTDRIERQARGVSEDNRLLAEQVRSLTKLVQGLEGRLAQLEDKAP